LPLGACLFALIGLERLHSYQNGGFRPSKLISSLPSVSLPPPREIDALLDQPFHYLGKGGTSFVFLGEDGHTVLKLFKHQHLFSKSSLFSIALPGASDLWRVKRIRDNLAKHAHKHHHFFLNSCKLAYEELKEETGLIYLTLQPNTHFTKKVVLIDSWGLRYSVDLSRTEFALQKKAELVFPYLENLLREKQVEQCKCAIEALIKQIEIRCSKGIGDRDPNLSINFGFIDGKAVEFDLGSYFYNPRLKRFSVKTSELFFATHTLQKWLEKHSPELLDSVLDRLLRGEN